MHPWLRNANTAPETPLGIVLTGLTKFQAMNKLKKAALKVGQGPWRKRVAWVCGCGIPGRRIRVRDREGDESALLTGLTKLQAMNKVKKAALNVGMETAT